MIRHIGSYSEYSQIGWLAQRRAKFNDNLNDAVAKINQYIMTINSCNGYEHSDKHGNLTIHGKTNLWLEIDDLIQRFDLNKVKLLPNPKNSPGFINRRHSASVNDVRNRPHHPRTHGFNQKDQRVHNHTDFYYHDDHDGYKKNF